MKNSNPQEDCLQVQETEAIKSDPHIHKKPHPSRDEIRGSVLIDQQ